jgi:CheY-like chemotaxis protein
MEMARFRSLLFVITYLLLISHTLFAQLPTNDLSGKAATQAEKYLTLIEEHARQDDKVKMAEQYNKLGFLYWENEAFLKAVESFQKSIELNEDIGNKNAVKNLSTNIGMIYYDHSEFQKSLNHFSRSYEINEAMGKRRDMIYDLINMGMAAQGMDDFSESNRMLQDALTLAQEYSDVSAMKNCYSLLAENHESMGNSEKSIEYYNTYLSLQKAITKEQIEKVEEEAEVAKKQKEEKEKQLEETFDTLSTLKEATHMQKGQIDSLHKETRIQELALKKLEAERKFNRLITISLFGGILFVLVILVLIMVQYRNKRKANDTLRKQNDEIETQKEEIELQRDIAHSQNKKITDSIFYAQRIQSAVLPPSQDFSDVLDDHFIFFRPRNIVSGDFYWMSKKEDIVVLAAADCTGHGVPGAFMSMLGVAFLNEIVNKMAINKHISSLQADEVLNQLRQQVISSLHQAEDNSLAKDGMDISLVIIDFEHRKLQFAGAYNSMYLVRDGELQQIKADRMPVSIHRKADVPFTNQEIKLQDGDRFYLLSDGYIDQFGGEKGMKFLSRRFKEMLLEIHEQPMDKQKEFISQRFDNWKGHEEQVDDVLVIGFKYSQKQKIKRPAERDWSDKRILIAEDTDVNYVLLVEALRKTGVQVFRAKNGKEAVEICSQNEFDLILMDINMPVMNGLEATKQIREFRKDVAIVAQTAQVDESDSEECLKAGCDDFISKPVDLKSFLNKVEKNLFK